jgi:purine-binding chemotaxis protein CheW
MWGQQHATAALLRRIRPGKEWRVNNVTLLVFTLDNARFGLAAAVVREVVRAVAIAALPKAPAIIEGVINYRGTVVPVLDVRQRFRLAPAHLDPAQHFVVALAGPRLVALRVDQATELLTVPRALIGSPATTVPGTDYVSGIARLPDGLLVIHDLERFLALEEAEQLDRAVRTRAPGVPARRRSAAS